MKRPALPTLGLLLIAALCSPSALAQSVGPLVGQVGTGDARFLYRPGEVVTVLRVTVADATQQVVASDTVTNDPAGDYVAHFHVTGLDPATRYTYWIDELTGGGAITNRVAGGDDRHRFTTALPAGRNGKLTVAFVSCADATSDPVWARMASNRIDRLFLMGDTPYVDSTALATVRQKHRDFLRTPSLAALIRQVPTVGTWDDHDFGLNDGNGWNFATFKAITRQAFTEYRAHDQYGTGSEGVYHRADAGPLEVFLLDPRWFSQTGPSPVDPAQVTCFGTSQWAWLRAALKQSRAPFKVLAQGMVWQDKKNTEIDDLYTYWYERDALLDFIREEKIAGVVLLGGDIHVSRHLVHPQRVGYDLHDFVTSPAHTAVIPTLDVYHPDLEWSSILDRQFLTMTADTQADPPVLTVRYLHHNGNVLRTVTIPYDQLTPREGAGLGRDLRAWWTFDQGGTNASVLGPRVDAVAVNGATLSAPGGARGNAATFVRANSQYLLASRSPLPENCAHYTVSLWCQPATLPAHGTAERAFLLESIPQGSATTSNEGYSLSLGFLTGTAATNINLQLFTRTLLPAPTNGVAPSVLAQGGFNTYLDRNLFTGGWVHVAYTFDSAQFRLFVNGLPVSTLPITPGPIAEIGGLVLGGHRAGTGRNYDGRLDEVAIWSRVLGDDELNALYNGGTPEALPTAVATVDADGDTLPDWWEIAQGLDPQVASDADSDGDGDGVAAFVEWAQGTSPLHDDTTHYTHLRTVAVPGEAPGPAVYRHPSDGRIRLQVGLESSTNVTQWTVRPANEPGAAISTTNGLLTVTRTNAPAAAEFHRFTAANTP